MSDPMNDPPMNVPPTMQYMPVHRAAVGAAPVLPGWACISVAWFLFIVPYSLCGLNTLVGWALILAAIILSIIVMSKGQTVTGIIQLVCALVGSPIIYVVAWAIWAALGFGQAAKTLNDAMVQEQLRQQQQRLNQYSAPSSPSGSTAPSPSTPR